jgi:hypothetical protein
MRRYHEHLEYLFGTEDPFNDDGWTHAFREAAIAVYASMFEHRSQS